MTLRRRSLPHGLAWPLCQTGLALLALARCSSLLPDACLQPKNATVLLAAPVQISTLGRFTPLESAFPRTLSSAGGSAVSLAG